MIDFKRCTFQAYRLSDRMVVTRSMFISFSAMNYGINFYVYVLSSSKFRRDLKLTFSCIFWPRLSPTRNNSSNICRPVYLIRPSINERGQRSIGEVEDQSLLTIDQIYMSRSCDDDDVR